MDGSDAEAKGKDPAGNSGPHVLIVEDDRDLSLYWSSNLLRRSCQVTQVYSRQAAVRILRRERPDYLIVDLGLPDGSGIEVVREARRRNPDAKCVVVSGFPAESADARDALTAGACAYLQKPCWWEHIENVLLLP